MEQRFEKRIVPCLRQDLWQIQEREQTQELRLTDGMPDIGGVLAAWGQCVMRGKEWLGDSIGVSGGVMVWVLYEPADGTQPRTIEAWIPVQGKWNLPKTQREGSIRSEWLLRGVDARTVSARKMMVRATVSLLAEVLEPWDAEVYNAAETEPDVQLLRSTYPAVIPQEAGEKAFLLEEALPLNPPAEQLLYCRLTPELTEQKVIGGKAVFRGNGLLHLLYRGEDGQLYSADHSLPFSQFSDLDRDYDKDATLSVMMALSNLEPELTEGNLNIKCGMVAQYLVHDINMLELVADAYSPSRHLRTQTAQLELPMVLDRCLVDMSCQIPMPNGGARMVDVSVQASHPRLRRTGEQSELEMAGTAQMLYYDDAGNLRGSATQWSDSRNLPCDESATVQPELVELSALRQDGPNLRSEIKAEAQAVGNQGIEMVMALELGNTTTPDPNRPSLILRRPGDQTLWNLAKATGSTVDAIRRANGLTTEPMDDRLLLIPIL